VNPRRTGPRIASAAGFTLIELIVTVAILALLASVAVPMGELAVQRTRERELRQALRDIRGAIDAYKQASDEGRIRKSVDASGYPPSLEALVDGVDAQKSESSEKIYFLRRIPRDPFSGDFESPAAATWGKRSYESPPERPREGADVYDVYSRSDGIGINGRPYREW